ncbi:hypothetical protein C1Y63_09690 [Corynebacterium sp. 13CS0277]|uniref:SA1002 family membrane protein n=1 Tax=Corynebacterium sp. 13CS0277 TaxID=2071994 RepID=UPI000D0339BB|nr:hypothetical protein [Corynebacterium sp. 13CS0277]PRQ10805.1 hypothetical protein C1Y63_09690 [Corynebacterium sp. 13CS0277]
MAFWINLAAILIVVICAGLLMRPHQGFAGPKLILRVLGGLVITALESALLLGFITVAVLIVASVVAYIRPEPFESELFRFSPAELMVPALAVLGLTGTTTAWIHRHLVTRFPRLLLTPEETDFAEYIIQWTTIYLTVYQLIFQTLSDAANDVKNATGVQVIVDVALQPDNLNLTILPLLFCIWVAIAIEKLYQTYGLPGEQDAWAIPHAEPTDDGPDAPGTGPTPGA